MKASMSVWIDHYLFGRPLGQDQLEEHSSSRLNGPLEGVVMHAIWHHFWVRELRPFNILMIFIDVTPFHKINK